MLRGRSEDDKRVFVVNEFKPWYFTIESNT
jgi:hypothetical protein